MLLMEERIRRDSEALVVIGIGGSYLGARAVVEVLNSPYANVTLLLTALWLLAGVIRHSGQGRGRDFL
jgi:hypothetical protein